ncbi:MAG: hypothetical protein JO004_02705, partial [Methylobacteriaceae bacterium]|nr:hypothetical protein [Methylobacteriaceae bacterium]
MRFSNRDVMTEMEVVLETIFATLANPTPSPTRVHGLNSSVAGTFARKDSRSP